MKNQVPQNLKNQSVNAVNVQQQGDSYIFEGIDPTANRSLQQQQQQQQQYDLGIYEETIQSDNCNLLGFNVD